MAAVSTIGIVGAGTMGAGIAQVAASNGFDVTLVDTEDAFVQRGMQRIEDGLGKQIDKGRMESAERDRAKERVTGTTNIPDLGGVELVIEAVVESFEVKASVFHEVAEVVTKSAIVTSNTSSISITALAATVPHPERFAGMHFFNPVPVLPLVEVVRGMQTSDQTADTIRETAQRLGKTPVVVADQPGFAANRILIPMINEAIFAVADGVASAEEIDTVMKLGASHPMGPLALADLIGLDVCLHIMEVLHRDMGDDKYRPALLLRQMVAAGRLGRKSGGGFYGYGNS